MYGVLMAGGWSVSHFGGIVFMSEVVLPLPISKVHVTAQNCRGIIIDDVAYGLAKIQRYAGLLPYNLNVAMHSVNMCAYFYREGRFKEAMYSLLHDAAEIVLSDIPSYAKARTGVEFKFYETAWHESIIEGLVFSDAILESVVYDNDVRARVNALDKSIVESEMDLSTPKGKEFGADVYLAWYRDTRSKLVQQLIEETYSE